MIWGAIIAAVVSAAAAAAMAPRPGNAPIMNTGEGAEADADSLAARRAVERASQLGQKIAIPTGRTTYQTVQKRVIGIGGKHPVPYDPKDFEPGGKYANVRKDRIGQPYTISVKEMAPEVIRGDFTGLGDADVAGTIAKQLAGKYLELGDKYGPQFIAEAKRQLELADPEGTAAREQLFKLIQEQVDADPQRPVADRLTAQVLEETQAGNRMTEDVAGELGTAAGGANAARGDKLDAGLLRQSMESGFAGQARADAGRQKQLGLLTSGTTPEDVKYRRNQQNRANLAAFAAGQSPVTQFQSLAGAQQGATPMAQGRPLPTVNPNAEQAANEYGLTGWRAKQSARLGQANNWIAGLSGMLSAAGTAVAAKP